MISVCIAGATGWTGRALVPAVVDAPDLELVSAVSRSAAGRDLGEAEVAEGAWWVLDALPVGQWNAYEIRVDGPQSQTYTVLLNGAQVTQFNNPHAGRGLPSRPDAPSFIGLQAHTGNVAFRNIELQAL